MGAWPMWTSGGWNVNRLIGGRARWHGRCGRFLAQCARPVTAVALLTFIQVSCHQIIATHFVLNHFSKASFLGTTYLSRIG